MRSPRTRLPEVQQAVLTGPVSAIDAVVGALRASDRQGEIAALEYRRLDLVKAIRLGRAADAQYLTNALLSQSPESLLAILQAVERCPERQEGWFRSIVESVREAANETSKPVSGRDRSGTAGSGRLPVAARVSLLIVGGALGVVLGIGLTMYWLGDASSRTPVPVVSDILDVEVGTAGERSDAPVRVASRWSEGLPPDDGSSGRPPSGVVPPASARVEAVSAVNEPEPEPESLSSTEASEGGQIAAATTEGVPAKSPTPTRADLLRASREGIEEGLESERELQPNWDGRIPADLRASIVEMGKALRRISVKLGRLDEAAASGLATTSRGVFASQGPDELAILHAVERTMSLFDDLRDLIHSQPIQSAGILRRRLDEAGIVLDADPEQSSRIGIDDRWFALCGTNQDLFLDHLLAVPPDPADVAGSIAAAHPEWMSTIDFDRSQDRLYEAWRIFQALEDCSDLGRTLRSQIGRLDELNPVQANRPLLALEVAAEGDINPYDRRQPGTGRALREARVGVYRDLTALLEELAMTDGRSGLGAVLTRGVSRDRDGHSLGWMLHAPGDRTQTSRPLALLERLRVVNRELAGKATSE